MGLSISAIRKFVEDHPRVKTHHLTTSQVNSEFVKPETKDLYSSYLELYHGSIDDATGSPLVADATVFVSHAWKYAFYDIVVNVMEQYAQQHPGTYFWFDLFTNNQNEVANKDFEWFSTTFRDSLISIGEVLLVLSPWNNPIPIQRAWCLFEIYNALEESGVVFSVKLPEKEIEELRASLRDDPDCISEALAVIEAEKAQAKSESDRQLIFQVIRESEGGFVHMNEQVKDGLREWYVYQLKQAVNEEQDSYVLIEHCASVLKQFGHLDDALHYYTKSLQMELTTLGENTEAVAGTYNNMGNVCQEQGKLTKAIEYYNKSLETKKNVLGENSERVATSYNNIANVYCDLDETDKGLEYYNKSLKIRLDVLGDNHPDVAACYNNLAIVYEDEGDVDKALDYYNKSLAIQFDTLGETHMDVSGTYNNMALLYTNDDQLDKALEYYQKSLNIVVKIFGEGNPEVATEYNNMGVVYKNKGELDKALDMHHKALEIRLPALGEHHPSVATSLHNIGLVYDGIGRQSDALNYLNRALRIRRKIYSEDHPQVEQSLRCIQRVIKVN